MLFASSWKTAATHENRELSFDKSSPETQTYIRNRDKCHSNKFILYKSALPMLMEIRGETYKISSKNIKQRTWNFKSHDSFFKKKVKYYAF